MIYLGKIFLASVIVTFYYLSTDFYYKHDFNYGYRVCTKENICSKPSVLFKNKSDCLHHAELSKNRCYKDEELAKVNINEPICFKAVPAQSYPECIDL